MNVGLYRSTSVAALEKIYFEINSFDESKKKKSKHDTKP